jgi:hypothetical protein
VRLHVLYGRRKCEGRNGGSVPIKRHHLCTTDLAPALRRAGRSDRSPCNAGSRRDRNRASRSRPTMPSYSPAQLTLDASADSTPMPGTLMRSRHAEFDFTSARIALSKATICSRRHCRRRKWRHLLRNVQSNKMGRRSTSDSANHRAMSPGSRHYR